MDYYKIAIIHPQTDKNEPIIYLGKIEDDETHSIQLLEYATKKYKHIPIFQKLNYKHTPETISYFYTLIGDIIFINTTKDIKRHGYTGLLILPKTIDDKQKEILYHFSDSIKKYKIRILYNLSLEYGIVNGQEIYQLEQATPRETLELYFKMTKNKSR